MNKECTLALIDRIDNSELLEEFERKDFKKRLFFWNKYEELERKIKKLKEIIQHQEIDYSPENLSKYSSNYNEIIYQYEKLNSEVMEYCVWRRIYDRDHKNV